MLQEDKKGHANENKVTQQPKEWISGREYRISSSREFEAILVLMDLKY